MQSNIPRPVAGVWKVGNGHGRWLVCWAISAGSLACGKTTAHDSASESVTSATDAASTEVATTSTQGTAEATPETNGQSSTSLASITVSTTGSTTGDGACDPHMFGSCFFDSYPASAIGEDCRLALPNPPAPYPMLYLDCEELPNIESDGAPLPSVGGAAGALGAGSAGASLGGQGGDMSNPESVVENWSLEESGATVIQFTPAACERARVATLDLVTARVHITLIWQ